MAYDQLAPAARIALSDMLPLVQLAGEGNGPGELQRPRAIAIGRDSSVFLLDWTRRRLIRLGIDGKLIGDYELSGGVWKHVLMGPLIADVGNSRLLDYWLADYLNVLVPAEAFDTIPLVSALTLEGKPGPGKWGTPYRPPAGARLLRVYMQMGDMDVYRDSVFVLRNYTGEVEVFSLAESTRNPIRRVKLRSFRRTPEALELPSNQQPDEFGAIRAHVTIEAKSLAIALDDAGRMYVVNPLNDRRSGAHPWPREALSIYSRDGEHLASYRLPGVNTRDIALADDNSILILGHRDVNASNNSLQIFSPIYASADGSRCKWSFRPS